MRDSELELIADRMLTVEFVERLHEAKKAMLRSLVERNDYDDADLARDLGLPLPIARILMSFIGASAAEDEMADIVARNSMPASTGRH